ncbi:MAG: M23 family metallopeptidase [Bacteroidetes bacterium]|nr:M23 family metallopeptidase [Bacteroidota bacterium]
MKHCFLFLFILFLFPLKGISQRNIPNVIDTIETDSGAVILYRNHTWEYLGDEPVMMSHEDDTAGLFTSGWIHDQVFAYMGASKRDSIKDTLLILVSNGRSFNLPISGRLYRGFTYTHKGMDISLKKGDTVRAAFDGVVRYAKYNRGGFGNLVIIRHYNGLETYYAHLSKLKVVANQVVRSRDIVGLGGSTGRSRSPHLHFEVRYKDIPLDPQRMIDFDNNKLISTQFPITKKVFYPSDYDGKAVYYTIRSGDTLGRIAGKYHTSVKELCALNKIKTTTPLRVGRAIRVK